MALVVRISYGRGARRHYLGTSQLTRRAHHTRAHCKVVIAVTARSLDARIDAMERARRNSNHSLEPVGIAEQGCHGALQPRALNPTKSGYDPMAGLWHCLGECERMGQPLTAAVLERPDRHRKRDAWRRRFGSCLHNRPAAIAGDQQSIEVRGKSVVMP